MPVRPPIVSEAGNFSNLKTANDVLGVLVGAAATNGGIDVTSAGALNIGHTTATSLAIGDGAAVTGITIGGGAGLTAMSLGSGMGVGDVLNLAGVGSNTVIKGNLAVEGTTTTVDSETVLIADNHLYLNQDYEVAVAQTGGLVVNYLPIATTDTVAGAYTAGVAATSNPTVVTTGAATFAVGQFIQLSGTANPGLYEVLSHAANLLTIRGVGTTATIEDFTQNQFVAEASDAASISRVTVSVIRAGSGGAWETGAGAVTPVTFSTLATTAGATLQSAYVAGNTITTSGGEGDVTITGTEDFIVAGTVDVSLSTTGTVTQTGGGQVTLNGNVDATAGVDVSGGDITLIGSGNDVVFLDTGAVNHSISYSATAATNTAGGSISVTAQTAGVNSGGAGEAGGDVNLNGGTGGAGAAGLSPGVGGAIGITAGTAGAIVDTTGAAGGAVTVTSGTGVGAAGASGGAIGLVTGGGGTGDVTGGGGAAGDISLTTGTGGAGFGGASPGGGGAISLTTGGGGAGTASRPGGSGGSYSLTAGNGGTDNGANGGGGGSITFDGGNGADGGTAIPGSGGGAILRAGDAGALGASTGKAGGDVQLFAGGSSGAFDGGDVTMSGGAAFDTGAVGSIIIGLGTTSNIQLGNAGDDTTVTQVGVGQVTFTGNVDATLGLDVTGGDLTVAGSGNDLVFVDTDGTAHSVSAVQAANNTIGGTLTVQAQQGGDVPTVSGRGAGSLILKGGTGGGGTGAISSGAGGVVSVTGGAAGTDNGGGEGNGGTANINGGFSVTGTSGEINIGTSVASKITLGSLTDDPIIDFVTASDIQIQSQLNFTEIGTPTAPAANKGLVYTKDDGGATHLFFQNDTTEYQITPVGSAVSVTVGGSVASGDAVYISAANTVDRTDADAIGTSRVVGWYEGVSGQITTTGVVEVANKTTGAGTALTAGAPCYLSGTPGQITGLVPTSGVSYVVGSAMEAAGDGVATVKMLIAREAPVIL